MFDEKERHFCCTQLLQCGLWKSLICPDRFYNRVSRSDIAEKVNNPHTPAHTTPANNESI